MIIAYCLSVYAINFFKQPTFSVSLPGNPDLQTSSH